MILAALNKTSAFYFAHQENGYDNLQTSDLVFTSKFYTKVVFNPVNIRKTFTNRIYLDIKYNLEGMVLRGVSLTWLPWLEIGDCNELVCRLELEIQKGLR